ncbi:hypothetical protein QZH41_005767 [Actinostola sp. cb2023]|nr:hypothetical protein QZH41_005767 [Actinostola sp. cb2023]
MLSKVHELGSGKSSLFRQIEHIKGLKGASKIHDVPRKILRNHNVLGRDALQDSGLFSRVQERIIDEQSRLEFVYSGRGDTIISDHTVIDSLIHSSLRSEHDRDKRCASTAPIPEQSLSVYKSSLVVLLSPLLEFEDDGVRMKLSPEDREKAKHLYFNTFHKFRIPFLFLGCVDVEDRFKLILEALQGNLPLETSNLINYGKNVKPITENHTNFSFFLSRSGKSNCIRVPTIQISEHKYAQEWKTWEPGECNRFIERHGADKLVILAFDMSVKSTVVQKMLLHGVTVNGELYSFLGCSSSGLKERKSFMWKGSQKDADAIIAENGEFDEKSVSKRMARISLLFSAIKLTSISVYKEEVTEEQDLFAENGKCFTDGCGGISEELSKLLYGEISNPLESSNYLPAVYQIRYQGYKGVLALDPKLEGKAIKVRPSMKKFETSVHDRIGVCGYSKPHTFGHLNRQFLMLLSGLGVPNTVFEEKQQSHFEMVKTMSVKPENAIQVLQWQNKFEVAQRLMKQAGSVKSPGDDEYMRKVQRCIHSVQSKLVSESGRLRILIPESRNIYGVCDQTGCLEYGECFLRITDANVGYPKTIKGQVVVCKNPCYLLGDVRVLKAVDDTDKPATRDLNHLVDCIVFPVCGKRPHPDEIAGSDLDGDMFFVTWDSDLIPPAMNPPYDYPGAVSKPQGRITLEKTLKYFALQNETQKLTGKVDKYFRQWANAKGVESDECARLGMLFSRVIDSAKSGEKFNSKDLPIPPDVSDQKFIWQVLEKRAEEFVEDFNKRVLKNETGFPNPFDVDEEFVESVVRQEMSNISEFAKFQFAWSYVQNHCKDTEKIATIFVSKYTDHINFALFSSEQKREAVELGIPAGIIINALNKSRLLGKDDIEEFSMHSPPNSWKFYFRADHETFEWPYLLKALTKHEQCLLVLRLPDQVTIALQFLKTCQMGEEQRVDSGTISGYFYSGNFGYRKKYILGSNYTLDLTTDVLQLYRHEKNQTFVCLKATDYSTRSKSQLGDENLFPISVDLLRFERRIFSGPRRHPLLNKIPFVRIEVFVENKGGSVPYFDTFQTNGNELITETENLEEEHANDVQRDFSCLLSDKELDVQVCETEDYFKTALRGTVTAGQPILFHNIMSSWLQKYNALPSFVPDLFIALLENMVVITAPLMEQLPEPVTEAVRNAILAQSFQDPSQLFKLAGFLFRLHLEDLAASLIVRDIGDYGLTVTSFLGIFGDWQTWWFVTPDIAKQSICNAARVASECVSPDEKPLQMLNYVLHLGQLHFQDLLQDIEAVQERMNGAKADFSISNLKLEIPSDGKFEIVSFIRAAALHHRPRITQGQLVAITRQVDFRRTPNHESCCCLAQVKTIRIAPLTINVKLFGKVPMTLTESSGKSRLWKMDLIANITTFTRVMDALKKLATAERDLPSLLSVVTNPRCIPPSSSLLHSDPSDLPEKDTLNLPELTMADNLNPKQKEAVRAALGQTVTLIEGPPGTGKTTVACEIIKQVNNLKKSNGILVVAETNIAVDNIVKKLRNDLPFDLLRIGTEEGVDREVYDLTLEGQLMKLEETEGKKTSYRDDQGMIHRRKNAVKSIFKNTTVVLTTCAGAGDPVLEPYAFEFVLVDEATQTKETTLLCSLMHGAKQLIMIGDPKQLGPIVPHGHQVPCFSDLPDVTSLSKTLFHRLYDIMPSTLLNSQHRMHPELVRFPSEEFYGGQLISGISKESRCPPLFPWPDQEKPFCFIDVESREERFGTSFCNNQEIKVVQQVLDMLLDIPEDKMEHRLSITDIAILTLYQSQAKLLSCQIKPKVEVRSIDGFQGREKEVIIVSTVRSNPQGSLGFADSANRLNVLLTRAKRGLIVVGNLKTFSKSDLWNKWLQAAPMLDVKATEVLRNGGAQGYSVPTRRKEATSRNRGSGATGGDQRDSAFKEHRCF